MKLIIAMILCLAYIQHQKAKIQSTFLNQKTKQFKSCLFRKFRNFQKKNTDQS